MVGGPLFYTNGKTFDNSHATDTGLELNISFTSPPPDEAVRIEANSREVNRRSVNATAASSSEGIAGRSPPGITKPWTQDRRP